MKTQSWSGRGQEVLDLLSHLGGMLLMRPVARIGIDQELSVRQFAIQDPYVLQREERISVARNDQYRLAQVLQSIVMTGLPAHEVADEPHHLADDGGNYLRLLTRGATCATVDISPRFVVTPFREKEITNILECVLRMKGYVEHDICRRCR